MKIKVTETNTLYNGSSLRYEMSIDLNNNFLEEFTKKRAIAYKKRMAMIRKINKNCMAELS